jgi:hypothetical protein
MNDIFYNSAVAQHCGNNGIIKAVLLNYIYNYHRQNPRKKAGYPASISLAEFVYQYTQGNKSLWKRSFIHRILADLCKDGHLIKIRDNNMPVYRVSDNITHHLTDTNAVVIGFDLGLACEYGIYVAIMSRFLLHVIDQSPNKIAYNLNVNEMAGINGISPAQIYRSIQQLEAAQVVQRVKSPVTQYSRSLCLSRSNPKTCILKE